jgi:hypothetical protein
MTEHDALEAGTPAAAASPAQLVVAGVERCLALASGWPAWNGQLIVGEPGGAASTWTPHKAVRRIADHLVDHLHEVEALLAGAEAMPDEWHGRTVTLDADLAPFAAPDLDEARSRLRRLARCYLLRFAAAGPAAWDMSRGEAWTRREIAEHVAEVSYYAEQVGQLA